MSALILIPVHQVPEQFLDVKAFQADQTDEVTYVEMHSLRSASSTHDGNVLGRCQDLRRGYPVFLLENLQEDGIIGGVDDVDAQDFRTYSFATILVGDVSFINSN